MALINTGGRQPFTSGFAAAHGQAGGNIVYIENTKTDRISTRVGFPAVKHLPLPFADSPYSSRPPTPRCSSLGRTSTTEGDPRPLRPRQTPLDARAHSVVDAAQAHPGRNPGGLAVWAHEDGGLPTVVAPETADTPKPVGLDVGVRYTRRRISQPVALPTTVLPRPTSPAVSCPWPLLDYLRYLVVPPLDGAATASVELQFPGPTSAFSTSGVGLRSRTARFRPSSSTGLPDWSHRQP